MISQSITYFVALSKIVIYWLNITKCFVNVNKRRLFYEPRLKKYAKIVAYDYYIREMYIF